MKQLFDLFDEIGLPYFRQGSMSDEEYAPSFFTFWNIDSPNLQIRDNNARSYAEYVQVGFYTNDARLIYSVMDDFIKRAKEKGFIVEGMARDANADRDDYFGRICYLRIINKI
jgi:predicted lipase